MSRLLGTVTVILVAFGMCLLLIPAFGIVVGVIRAWLNT
jgi:hypothetical protein